MTSIDQFESVFRAAARTVFTPEPVEVGSVLVISDRTASEADDFAAQARTFLEEENLLGRFPDEYASYQQRTGRLFPRSFQGAA